MNKNNRFLIIGLAVLSLWGCGSHEAKNDLNIDRTRLVTAEATVEAVNMQTRMVALRDTYGQSFTVYVGKEAVNLPQVRVGDTVNVEYEQALAVRMAKPGEMVDETTLEVSRAVPGSKPAASEVVETTVTARVENIDRKKEIVRLRLPDGGLRVVKVENPANLEKVKEGDIIVITYSEAFAISVRKK